MYALGAFVAPIALTFLIGAQFVGQSSDAVAGVSRTLLMFHIAANVLGVGLFLIAGAAGSVYLVQERRLRTKKRVANLSSRLPPLDSLDRTTHRLLLAGFPLLTFGVVTGAVFTHQLTTEGSAEFLRSFLGYSTWLLLGSSLGLAQNVGLSWAQDRLRHDRRRRVHAARDAAVRRPLEQREQPVIVVVGLSHRTAPIAVREKLVLEQGTLPDFLRELVQRPEVGEAVLVSTCNRVELVAAGRAGFDSDLGQVAKACVLALAARAPDIAPHLYSHTGGAAVRHLFRVAASLDSMVLGEPQILGQVKEADELARRAGTVGSVLHRTLPRAIRAAKRVRTETAIGNGQVSVPSVAVDLTRQIFGDLTGHTALLVGSGEMAEAVARLLKTAGASILVVGRTLSKVEALAQLGRRQRAAVDSVEAEHRRGRRRGHEHERAASRHRLRHGVGRTRARGAAKINSSSIWPCRVTSIRVSKSSTVNFYTTSMTCRRSSPSHCPLALAKQHRPRPSSDVKRKATTAGQMRNKQPRPSSRCARG